MDFDHVNVKSPCDRTTKYSKHKLRSFYVAGFGNKKEELGDFIEKRTIIILGLVGI